MPRKAKITPEQDLTVANLYLGGMTQQELADKFKVGTGSIETSLRRTNTQGRRAGSRTNNVDFSSSDEILKEYNKLRSVSALSKKFGCNSQLRAFLRNEGVLRPNNQKIEVNDKLILSLFSKGLKFKEITEKTGYSEWSIGKSLKDQGIDSRERRKGKVDLKFIEKLWLSGRTCIEITEITEFSNWNIRKGLTSLGYDLTRKINKTDFKIYKDAVAIFTEISWHSYYDEINPNRHTRGRFEYHVDHIFSQKEGFINSVPPYIIGHKSNLQMLYWKDNASKFTASSKTLDQLFEDCFNS